MTAINQRRNDFVNFIEEGKNELLRTTKDSKCIIREFQNKESEFTERSYPVCSMHFFSIKRLDEKAEECFIILTHTNENSKKAQNKETKKQQKGELQKRFQ